jgi:hypothetical protein
MINDDEERKKKARKKTGFSEGNRFIRKEIDSARTKKETVGGSARFGYVSPIIDLGAWSFMVSVFEGCLILDVPM